MAKKTLPGKSWSLGPHSESLFVYWLAFRPFRGVTVAGAGGGGIAFASWRTNRSIASPLGNVTLDLDNRNALLFRCWWTESRLVRNRPSSEITL